MDITDVSAASITKELVDKIDQLNKKAWEVHITDPKLGLELSTRAKKLSEEISYQKGLAYAIRNIGVSHRYLSNLEEALSFSFQALEMFVQIGEKTGEAQAYVSIGAIYYYMGDYERSLDYFLKGIRYNEGTGNKQALAYGYNGAGYIYGVLGDHKKGLEFLQQALSISKEMEGSYDLQSSILDSIAVAYVDDGQLDKAYEAYLECLDIAEKSSQKINMSYALFGIGDLMERQNQLDEAKKYFLKSLTIRSEIGYKVGEATSLLHLGKLLLKQNDDGKAHEYLLESLKVAEEIKAKAVIYEVHEALAELYEKKKDMQSFAKHYKLFHKYKSDVFKDEQESKQKYLNIQHEMEKLQKEAEINRLTNVVMKEKNDELQKKTEELEQSYNSVSVLSKIGRDITSTLDLDTILNTVYENVNQLMDATVFGIGIYKPEENSIEYRLAIEEGKRFKPYQRNMSDKTQLAVWCIENNKEVFINDISKEYSKYLKDIDYTVPAYVVLEDGSIPKNPNSLIYLPLQVKDKIIGLISVQSYEKNAYSQNHLNILKTLASYTSAALYNAASYESLQSTLNTLKQTQEQLVQSEKMASLGELTAGIAHEIQNPLNFVNNFSEVNKELIDEMKEEIAKGNFDEVKAISNDIKKNEEKISHHGKRADAIVKGMLQHSRSSTGVKEPTNINALADEYLRLAYHGLRAKDKSFNAKFETHLDKSIGQINIVAQDIGRVLVNLINNAFYAVSEKKKQTDAGYEPTVTVGTKNLGNKVEIMVKDNGAGMPPKILEKIFQPFFTTKPTGQGTGLGLSLSYDIITKGHGGEIKVNTKENEGTDFTIHIPIA
ncbi:MAG TPA: tetratricopeptide repeat protein [Chitinophagaceae bacterium]|nr:tetratricopeptide repeat protein [Chitinophagaceae bacterium]